MVIKQYISDAIIEAMRTLTQYSYNGGWTMSRELAPIISARVKRPLTSQAISRHLMRLEDSGVVEKRIIHVAHQLHEWRLSEWEKWTQRKSGTN